MICTFCGAEIEDDSVFCTTCGSKLDSVPVEDTDHRINESYSDNDSANNTTIAFDEDAAIGNPSSQDDDGMNEGGIDEEAASEWDESAEPQDENETLDKDLTVVMTEEAGEPVDVTDQESIEPVSSAQNANGKLTLAIIMLSAALLAITGFLLIDKVLSLTPSESRATTIRIISQSEDVTVKPGTITEFFVDAEGTNLTYQWYVKKRGEQLWHLWKGHDNFKTTSKANKSWDGMQVYCIIVDNNRTSIASDIITISIEK